MALGRAGGSSSSSSSRSISSSSGRGMTSVMGRQPLHGAGGTARLQHPARRHGAPPRLVPVLLCIASAACCALLLGAGPCEALTGAALATDTPAATGPTVAAPVPVDIRKQRCLRDIQLNIMSFYKDLFTNFKGKTALMDVAVHPNLGDNLLWLGAKRIFHHYERTPDVLCSSYQTTWVQKPPRGYFPLCLAPQDLLATLGTPATVFWHPGGNWGDVWQYVHGERMNYIKQLDEFLVNDTRFQNYDVSFVQLPNSVYYNNQTTIDRDRGILTSLKRLKFQLHTRQHDSYEIAQRLLGLRPEQLVDAVDLVYNIGPATNLYPTSFDVLLLFRLDKESCFYTNVTMTGYDEIRRIAQEEFAGVTVNGRPVTFNVTDWRFETKEKPLVQYVDLADVRMQAAMRIVGQGHIVVTNRLHGAVAATLSGIPNFWFDGDGGGQFKGYYKIFRTNGRAWEASPERCTENDLESWRALGQDEKESYVQAIRRAKALLQQMALEGRIME